MSIFVIQTSDVNMIENKHYSNNLGAVHALKGYHHQFLYSLLRILKGTEQEQGFFPEGKYEDLDIYDSENNIIEIIQIKSLKNTLTLSDILNAKDSSFIKRTLSVCADSVIPKIKLLSFGAVSDDIINLASHEYSPQLITKLKSKGLKDVEIDILEEHFEYEIVSEKNVSNDLFYEIEHIGLFSDLKITLDLFIYWIYNAARAQLKLNKSILVEELLNIGKFQSERNSFIKHFGSLIKPLLNEDIDTKSQIKLKEDFYKGISAEYNHILANADVMRDEKLKDINRKFQKSDIIFIHGASGQGKSTLAYRFLSDYCGNTTVFELRGIPTEISKLYELINSLEGIAKGVNFPITLYLDIVPGRKEWISIIEELSSKKIFKFIVTIRTEDWNAVEIGGRFDFEEIELYFDKEEGSSIYQRLNEISLDLHFTNFEEAWRNFGESGPLMEFVYLITQKDSLPSKLKQQINKIRDTNDPFSKAQIEILRYVTLVDSFDSEIKVSHLASHLKLDKDSFLRAMELLEKEYLVKTVQDGFYIRGLHPIRSKIIAEMLFDENLFRKSDYSLNALDFISDDSILNFYLNAFRRANLSPHAFLEKVKDYRSHSWQAYYLILKSLIWKGIEDYVNNNISLLNDVYQKYGSAWVVIIDFNFAFDSDNTIQNLDIFPEEVRNYSKSINEELENKKMVFKYAEEWLKTIPKIDIVPELENEWDSFALFTLWINYFNLNKLEVNYTQFNFHEYLQNVSLSVLSHVMCSISLHSQKSQKHLSVIEPIFLQKLYQKYNIISLKKNENIIDCLYFYDIIDEKIETDKTDIIHEKSIRIIELLRFAYPSMDSYKIRGIGHKTSFILDDYDSSKKEIPSKNLPLQPFVEVNSILVNLFNYKHRPNNWIEYVDKIISKRKLYTKILESFYSDIIKYHKAHNYSSLYSYLEKYTSDYEPIIKDVTYQLPQLPKIIVDEWGRIGENQDSSFAQNIKQQSTGDRLTRSVISISRYRSFLKSIQSYNSSIDNFIQQSIWVLIRRMKQILKQDYETIPDNERISVVNLFEAHKSLSETQFTFNSHFSKYINIEDLSTIEKEENIYISGLCSLYRHFIYTKSHITNNIIKAGGNRLLDVKYSIQKKIEDKLRNFGKAHQIKFRINFNNDKSCYIVADFTDTIKSIELINQIYDSLYAAFEQPEHTSLRALIIETYFPDFYIIPLVYGKSLDGQYYKFKSYNLREKRSCDLGIFNFLPDDIPSNIIDWYKIDKWDYSLVELKELQEMVASASTLHLLGYNLKQFQDIESDDIGENIVSNYIQKTGQLFQEQLQKCMDILTMQITKCNNGEFLFENGVDKLNFYQLLLDTFPMLYPNDDLYEKKSSSFTINPEEMESWLPRLETLRNNVAIIYYYLAVKMISS
ncbi:MAG: hypothetical protein LBU84_06725 [Prevotella sp.]|jgi:hypothetical protein|nr:hypothetical protein [Prevotella sp.]